MFLLSILQVESIEARASPHTLLKSRMIGDFSGQVWISNGSASNVSEIHAAPSIVLFFSLHGTLLRFHKSLAELKRRKVSMAEKESSSDREDDPGKDTSSSSTPNLWMLKWLQLRHQSLLDGMQNAVPKILDYLVDKGKIDLLRSEVYQVIMLDTTVPLQKAQKLLAWLATQPPDVFWTFQHAIRQDSLQTEAVHRLAVSDKEMRDLMERVKSMSLPERLDLMSCPGVLKAREELRKTYRSRDKLLMSAGLAKGKMMTMDKILVNVCLLSSEEAKKAFEKPSFSSHRDQERCEYLFSKILEDQPSLLSLEEVFKAKEDGEEDPDKIVASGGAGCGKSVCFTRKAPYDWATGELWQQFALLYCLELRDKSLWQAKTLADLLKLAQLGLSSEEQEEVHQFITSHPDKVVIVCDGLDEGSVDEFKGSLMWSLLQGKCVGIPSSLRLVVTTRPCSTAGEMLQSTSYRGVEVVGFTKEDVSAFARKYLGHETGGKLLSLLDKQPSIASMMHAPLFCLLVCDLFQEEQELPSRRTEIFQKVVVALLHRYAQTRDVQVPFQDCTDAPTNLKELVIGLGKVAFEGLQKKQLYFTDIELVKAGMPLEALELGLLVKSESTNFWKLGEYTFSHLTIQEFLAALYVSSKVLQTNADMTKLLEEVRFDDGHLMTFWIFLAGLLEGNLVEGLLAKALPNMSEWRLDSRGYHLLQLYRCYAESILAQSGTPSASVEKLLNKYQVEFGVRMSASDCAVIGTVLQSHPQTERINKVRFDRCHMQDAGLAQLLPGLQRCKSIKALNMSGNSLSSQHMSAVSGVLANNASTLADVTLSSNKMEDDGLEKLSGGLKQCRELKKLWLGWNGLTFREASTLSDVLSSLPNLEMLSVSENDLGDNGIAQLAHGLQFCTRLRRLYINRTALTPLSFPILHRLLSPSPGSMLPELMLGWHDFSEEDRKKLVDRCGGARPFTRLRFL